MADQKNQIPAIRFGMAFSAMNMNGNEIREYLDFQEFSAVELPWENIASPDQSLLREAKRRGKTILCGGITDPKLTQEIPFAEEKIRRVFADQLTKSLELLASRGIHTATLECPADRLLGDKKAEQAFREILLAQASVLYRGNMTLLLPCAIPSAHSSAEHARFIRNTLLPNIKLRLDVHPWQMQPQTSPQQVAGTLRFETRAVTFRYDADCGNRILPAHVKAWSDYLTEFPQDCMFLLCPFSRQNRMTYPEANQFAEIIRQQEN